MIGDSKGLLNYNSTLNFIQQKQLPKQLFILTGPTGKHVCVLVQDSAYGAVGSSAFK